MKMSNSLILEDSDMESASLPGSSALRSRPVRPTRAPEPPRGTRNPTPKGRWGLGIGPWVVSRSRAALVLAAHALVFVLIFLAAYVVRFDGVVPALHWRIAIAILPLVLSLKLLAVVATRCHRGWWRYATFADLVNLVQA